MIKKVFQGIFLTGTILLFLVCVAGFFGLFEAVAGRLQIGRCRT